jgi:thiol:disulfide interchange protein
VTCKVNEKLVLNTPEVVAAFARHDVVPMKADWTNRDDTIARFLADHGRYGIPFYMLYRPGREPHVFGELISKRGVADVLAESAAR